MKGNSNMMNPNDTIDAIAGIRMAAAENRHGIDRSCLDTEVRPADDFYLFSCGGWMKSHPLPPEHSRFGNFDLLHENARLQLKELITNLADDPESKVKGTNAQKVCDIYNLGMDEERLNREGAAPLRPMLERIRNFKREDLFKTIAWIHKGISSSFFGSAVGPDAKDSDRNILHICEAGIGLGDRDYYLEKNENNDRILAAYEVFVKRIMELVGYSPEEQQRIWDTVITIETKHAEKKMPREERRNPDNTYNKRTLQQLRDDYPNIEWDVYLSELGISGVEDVILVSPGYMKHINDLLPTLSDTQIKDLMTFDVVVDSSGLLSDDFIDASFELYGRVMSGQEEQNPRWKRAMSLPNAIFGNAVGELYVKKYFPARNKEYMIGLVENLRKALGIHIDNLSWMSDATKAKAREKLATLKVKIGYPDKWEDYSGIEIDPEKSYQENVYNASVWFVNDNISKLHKPVDKEKWMMNPQTVNAYYSPISNEICFPAGILQAPFFDPDADDALNYGAIGVVIGHEMTHGFDDQGRKFDKDGNFQEWWLKEDEDRFNKLADILVEQFNKVEVAPGVFANGKFTLGENIADQGGLRIALTAYLNSLEGKEAVDIDGFSPIQRFYLAYAISWAGNIRPEDILLRTKTDSHSLDKNRVNETLRNLSPFFEAFGIKDGDPMFRPENERVVIW